jgi:hypothetical protein
VDAPSDVSPPTLVSLYGENAANLEELTIEALDAALLPSDQRASAKAPVRFGWVEVEGTRALAVLGPEMGKSYMGDPLFAQAFKPRGKDTALLTAGPARQWGLWSAEWDRDPRPDLLVLVDAAGAPHAARWLGATLRVREVKLLPAPTFLVEELGSRSGVDDPITLTVIVHREKELRVANRYPLGPRSAGAECDPPSAKRCVIQPPGSVEIAATKPPTLRVRVVADEKCLSPSEALAGCEGAESLDVWDEAAGRFVPGTPKKVTLVSAVR